MASDRNLDDRLKQEGFVMTTMRPMTNSSDWSDEAVSAAGPGFDAASRLLPVAKPDKLDNELKIPRQIATEQSEIARAMSHYAIESNHLSRKTLSLVMERLTSFIINSCSFVAETVIHKIRFRSKRLCAASCDPEAYKAFTRKKKTAEISANKQLSLVGVPSALGKELPASTRNDRLAARLDRLAMLARISGTQAARN